MIRSSVDLPVPLMPTTPTRSPSETVSDRSSNRTRSARRTATCWRSTSTATRRSRVPAWRPVPGHAAGPVYSGGAGTVMAGESVPPSTWKILPVTQPDAGEAR